jgi:demethylmenaquinone methyltransferase/2-methoxy-6-polyprenyl-1,4-benzoquinol methylase
MKSNNSPENWKPEERRRFVKWMFSEITPSYDLINHLLSGYLDILWRKFTAKRIPPDAKSVLDLATGTGDLAFEISRRHKETFVIGVDFVQNMLKVAKRKAKRQKSGRRVQFTTGDAMSLPFPDDTFDIVTIAFGFRNIPQRIEALQEISRVIKPGGKLLILELTFPSNLGLKKFFLWYLNKVIPLIGGLISGNRKAYSYLPDSIQDFLTPDQLNSLFKQAGIVHTKQFRLSLGISYLHEGIIRG